jgi:hypothetical protein
VNALASTRAGRALLHLLAMLVDRQFKFHSAGMWRELRGDVTRAAIEGIGSFLFALIVGIFGAILVMHWSVCEQDDRVCAFTGERQ